LHSPWRDRAIGEQVAKPAQSAGFLFPTGFAKGEMLLDNQDFYLNKSILYWFYHRTNDDSITAKSNQVPKHGSILLLKPLWHFYVLEGTT
jgi:hypothetical protein